MRAYRLKGWKSEPAIEEVAEPVPAPGQVVLKVLAAGACHSDLHIMSEFDESVGLPWTLPFTLGHENTGVVHALGDGVRGIEVGQQVAVHGAWGCGTCGRCRDGLENYCENPLEAPVAGGGGGLGLDGGMADYLLVPDARHLVPLPEGLDAVTAAPLTDAGLTPYHAVRRSTGKLGPTSTAVVIGVGGLGHLAVQILKAVCAARIVAVDKRPEALELAAAMGADETLDVTDAGTAIRAGTGGRGADVVLDFVGSAESMALAVTSARTLGDVTVVGIAGGNYPFGFFTAPYEASLQTTYWGSRSELVEVLELGARGLIRPEVTTFPLERVGEAYEAMRKGTLRGRAVIVP